MPLVSKRCAPRVFKVKNQLFFMFSIIPKKYSYTKADWHKLGQRDNNYMSSLLLHLNPVMNICILSSSAQE